jgi:hypothetical protein
MMRKIIFGLVIMLMVLSTFVLLPNQTSAASAFAWSQQQWPVSTDMNGICMGAYIDTVTRGKILEITWPSGFDLSGLTISDTEADSEVVFYRNNGDCTGTARVMSATPQTDRDLGEVDGQILRMTLETDLAAPFSFKIVQKAGATIITDSTAGNYSIVGSEKFTTSGQPTAAIRDFIYVGDLNKVNITADVDPSLTLTLTTTACNLGTLDKDNIKTCSYGAEVSTNAATGYTGFLKADGTFRNSTNHITDVSGGSVAAASEAYGVSTTSLAPGVTISRINDIEPNFEYNQADCTGLNAQSSIAMDASVLTTSDQSFAGATGPTDIETTYVCHAVGITATTPAGSYSQLVTVTAVGNF